MTEAAQTEIPGLEEIMEKAESAPYNPVLKIWQTLLSAAQNVRNESITPQWAVKVTQDYPQLSFADMPFYRDMLYNKIDLFKEVLNIEIESDDECLKVISPEEDLERNGRLYLNVLILWQKLILTWELDWNCEDPDAAVELATIADVHKMFFADNGIVALLEEIKFEMTDDKRELLTEELEELKNGYSS